MCRVGPDLRRDVTQHHDEAALLRGFIDDQGQPHPQKALALHRGHKVHGRGFLIGFHLAVREVLQRVRNDIPIDDVKHGAAEPDVAGWRPVLRGFRVQQLARPLVVEQHLPVQRTHQHPVR